MRPVAVYVKGVGRMPIDSELTVIMREKVRFTEALGWSYRFKSANEWVLVPLQEASVFVYEDRPEASVTGDNKRAAVRASVPHAANYVTPEGDLVP
jgi:hypothetical protein